MYWGEFPHCRTSFPRLVRRSLGEGGSGSLWADGEDARWKRCCGDELSHCRTSFPTNGRELVGGWRRHTLPGRGSASYKVETLVVGG